MQGFCASVRRLFDWFLRPRLYRNRSWGVSLFCSVSFQYACVTVPSPPCYVHRAAGSGRERIARAQLPFPSPSRCHSPNRINFATRRRDGGSCQGRCGKLQSSSSEGKGSSLTAVHREEWTNILNAFPLYEKRTRSANGTRLLYTLVLLMRFSGMRTGDTIRFSHWIMERQ
jgi:hypothetical protein